MSESIEGQKDERGAKPGISDGKAMRLSLFWNGAGAIVTQGAAFVIFLIMIDRLPLTIIGAFAFALVLVDLGAGAAKSAIMDALMIKRDFSRGSQTCAMALGLAAVGAIGAFLCLVGAPFAAFVGIEQAGAYLPALALIAMLLPVSAVMEAQLISAFQIRTLAIRNILAVVVGGAMGLAVVFGPYPEWALLAQRAGQYACNLILCWTVTRFVPVWRFDAREVSAFARLSGALWRNHLLVQSPVRAFEFLVGAILGAASLGAMRVLGRFNELLQLPVVQPLTGLMLPLITRAGRGAPEAAEAFMGATRLVAALSLPAFVGLALVAPEVVAVFTNAQYEPYWLVLSGLAIAGVSAPVMGLRTQVLSSMGKTTLVMRLTLFELVAVSLVSLASMPLGVIGVVWANAALTAVFVVISGRALLQTMHISFARYVSAISPPVIGVAVMGCAVAAVHPFLGDLAPALRLVVLVALGGTTYFATLFGAHRSWSLSVVEALRSRS